TRAIQVRRSFMAVLAAERRIPQEADRVELRALVVHTASCIIAQRLAVVDDRPLRSGKVSAHNEFTVKRTAHPILKRLGGTVRLLRLQHGLSQEALAELAGIDRSYMSGIERGLRNLSILQAMKLSTALHIAVHELLQPATAAAAPFEEHRPVPVLHDRHVDLAS